MNPDTIRHEVERLAAAGRKLEAIKLVRERAGLGLKEAKAFVEALERGLATTVASTATPPSAPSMPSLPSPPDRPLHSNAEQKAPSNVLLFLVIGMLIVLLGYLYIDVG
jgi:hypothetical protein